MRYDKISEMISRMSLEAKIGQLNQICFKDAETMKNEVRKGHVGSIVLAGTATAGNDEQKRMNIQLLNELQEIAIKESPSGIPLIFGRDVIHGHRTVLPIPLAMASSFNPELTKEAYRAVAKEASGEGVHWTFSPMLDVSSDPRWGRCIEGFGEDSYLTSKMGEAVVRGFQGEDTSKADSVAACAKHYIGYSAAEGGRDYSNAEISDYTLRNTYLPPFKAAVGADVATVMNSFNEVSGQPVASSRYLLYDLLKEELGFNGFIISDWGAVAQLVNQRVAKDRKEAAFLCANAELDMDMADGCYIENLHQLVDEGLVSEETINKMVYRVLSVKEKFGILENPYITSKEFSLEEHLSIAKRCSDESIILLKNNDVLPLDKSEKIAITGDFIHEKRSLLGSWTLDGDVNMVKSISDAFIECVGSDNVIISQSEYLSDEILFHLRKVDTVVIAIGESHRVTGENNCLSRIELPKSQLELIKQIKGLGKKVIGVLCFGRPVAIEEAEPYMDAVLYAWHCGTCTAPSVADIVYGKVNPSGKLPMTLPRNTGQIPIRYNYPALPRNGMSYYGTGDNYLDCRSTPMYPFGYGLSYTEFEYSGIKCENNTIPIDELKKGAKFSISIEIENVGKYNGMETVQCYISDLYASMTRPVRELKGFKKISIDSKKKKTVVFELGWSELAFYNSNGDFCVEPGEFEVYVGKDCTADSSVRIVVF